MSILSILLGSVMVANIALAFTIIFLERKNASSTWAWLMVLFFIPVLGFILYWIVGRSLTGKKIFKLDKVSKLDIEKEVNEQLEILKRNELKYKLEELNPYKELFYLHLKNSGAIYSQNNEVDLFIDGEDKFSALIR
ncbi:MAG: PLDc N-terminal domain-containing protein, partial [Bacillales bacterium]